MVAQEGALLYQVETEVGDIVHSEEGTRMEKGEPSPQILKVVTSRTVHQCPVGDKLRFQDSNSGITAKPREDRAMGNEYEGEHWARNMIMAACVTHSSLQASYMALVVSGHQSHLAL